MDPPVIHRKDTLSTMYRWRNKYQDRARSEAALGELLFRLCRIYHKPGLSIRFNQPETEYNPITKTISLRNLSLVSALHELAHHLYGVSERTACRWSVWLFYKTYPEQFEHCRFEGHMLKTVQPSDDSHIPLTNHTNAPDNLPTPTGNTG